MIEKKRREGIEWRKTRTRMGKKIPVGTLKILFSLFPFERRRFRFPSLRCKRILGSMNDTGVKRIYRVPRRIDGDPIRIKPATCTPDRICTRRYALTPPPPGKWAHSDNCAFGALFTPRNNDRRDSFLNARSR